jgi:hypothetical protein
VSNSISLLLLFKSTQHVSIIAGSEFIQFSRWRNTS